MKKIIAITAAALLAVSAFCMTGCFGQSSEQLIRDTLASELDAFKNMDDSAMSEIATVAENAGLTDMGIDSQEFAAAVLDGFDYSIDSVEVDGDTATATVTIISKSSSDFETRINEAVQSITSNPDVSSMDQETLMNQLSDAVMQAFQNTEVVTETATIEYQLENNVWEPVEGESSLAGLDSIVFAK